MYIAKAVKVRNLSIRRKTKLPYEHFQLVFRELQNYSCPAGLDVFSSKYQQAMGKNKFFRQENYLFECLI